MCLCLDSFNFISDMRIIDWACMLPDHLALRDPFKSHESFSVRQTLTVLLLAMYVQMQQDCTIVIRDLFSSLGF